MTTTLEPVLSGRERVIELTVRRATLKRWQRTQPNLDIAVIANRNTDTVRVRVVLKSDDLKPAGPECKIGEAEAYRAGNARGKRWWGIEVRDGEDFEWLDNFDNKVMAENAARQWFIIREIDPDTIEGS